MTKKYSRNLNRTYLATLIQKITTIHGFDHFNLMKGSALTIWVAIMVCNAMLTIGFIMVITNKFNANQIVTQVNANCKVNQVPFPAVSVCNFNMVSLKESQNIARVLRHYNRTEYEIHHFFDALPNLKNYNINSRKLGNFVEILSILKHHYFTMDTIMEEIHQKCDNLLLYCSFNRNQKNCNNIFSLIKTYEGYCCTFNYAALNDGSEVPQLPPDEDLEFYDDQNPDAVAATSGIITTSESGRMSGLRVVLNLEPDDYPSWSSVPYYGAKILLSDPNDYPETTIRYRYITLGESLDMKVNPMVFQSESDIRRVEPEKRACWFHDEALLGHTNRYSYETCHTECKMRNYLETCGCIPFKYPREKSTRICEFKDLECLNNVTVNKSIQEMHCQPICFMECRDKKYSITSDLTPFLPNDFPPNVTENRNISELAALQVYFSKSNCNCYKLTLLIDFNYFIATYGGVFSLSFGGSIITIFELTYILVSVIITLVHRGIHSLLKENKTEKSN